MGKDWSRIGEVTVVHRYGESRKYPSLKAAIRDNAWAWHQWGEQHTHRVEFTTYSGQRSVKIVDGANYVVFDELGLTVPVWRIAQEATTLGLSAVTPSRRRYCRAVALGYRAERHFRRGPVPGQHGWSWHHRRTPQTTPEIRENEFLTYDEEALAYGIRCRPRRVRPNLPDCWDESPRNQRGNGWKVHRRTQWRG